MFSKFTGHNRARLDALEAIKARVMIADAKLNITYLNGAVRELLSEAESDLRAELPRFSMATLVGSNIDVFHKNPAHQRKMLASLKEPYSATIRVGHHVFDLMVSPLFERDKLTGYVVEWANASERLKNLDFANRLSAVDKVQAMIEFSPDGTILTANANFLKATGYGLDELVGRHHSMLVDRDHAASADYTAFWAALNRGEAQVGEFARIGRDGRRVLLNASYNPIADERGRIVRIVKFATDVTERFNAVHRLGEGLTRLAAGELDCRLDVPFAPDFEPLRQNFNTAITSLSHTLGAVANASVEIDLHSSEVSSGASDLSQRTERQAASLEETAAALDEITVNVQNAAARSDEARKAAEQAKSSASHSAMVMGEAIDAMARIEDSSNKISSIIGVIDEISFQTNLLALNAGVEAARAGEAGKGFAVVAQEVRELAQRAASAAREIKELIAHSSGEVKSGVKLVSETGEALRSIEDSILVVNTQIQAIATAAKEQAIGLDEVNAAVNQMDQVTQQNAAMVEETSAASATLAGQAEQLRRLIEHFQLGNDAPQRPVTRQAPAKTQPAARPVRRAAVPATQGNAALKQESWSEF
ncbi:methyl-accepting chemotaxis protein [Allorhizobium borbori]|uniref:Methyl-accepting chemotaxis protein n=1 Tax=Allorhizobium borbori TaxID=485907 RepID=A0A7W6K4K0_9HYPH|nr:methyl-accepting chemotaxis protein [Allorhizobium borbori]MBB4104191.1 methyl-accepting chemotaxis protein [Allorhizobium borbori]